jgi:hypothetical protein
MRGERTQIFLSFDLDHDRDLHDRLLAESKDGTEFSIAGQSDRSPAPECEARVRAQIAGVDAVIVICGEHTDENPRVAAELRITREEKKPHLLLWGRRERMCKKPAGARPDESMYGWTPENMRRQLTALRMEQLKPSLEHLRRRTPPKPPAGT